MVAANRWPTRANIARSADEGITVPLRPTGLGATLGTLIRAFPPLILPFLPFATGLFTGGMVLLLLPRLFPELVMQARYPEVLEGRRKAGRPRA